VTAPGPSHDGFVRRLLSHRDVAEAQLRWLLPAGVVGELDWTTLRQGPTDTADVLGRARRSDVIFDVRTAAGEPLLVHVLVEHQRSADQLMAFRMVQYQTRIWQAFVDQSDQTVTTLPPILPIVLYNGSTPWRGPVAIEALAPAPATWALGPHQLSGRFVLFDLSQVPDEQIAVRSANPHLQLGLLALKHTDDGQAWERLLNRAATILEVIRMVEGQERMDELLHYMFRAARPPSDEERRRVIQLLPNVEKAMTTWAQQIEERARAEGRLEKLRETAKALLTARFGTLPAEAESKLDDADEAQLDRWVLRFARFDGSLDELLAS